MEWKGWAQIALLGCRHAEPYAILLVRVALGLFFAISGANKLFTAGGRQSMHETLVKAGIPFPGAMSYFVSGVEMVGGCMVAAGFLTMLASAALLMNMLVAIVTTSLPNMPKEPSPLKWFDNLLYLPEVLYVLFFVWLICSGAGRFSVDAWLATKL